MNEHKQRKKSHILGFIGIVCVAIVFVILSSVGHGGGEIGFDAKIISVEGNWITAEVTNEGAFIFSKKLPNKIEFDSTVSGVSDLKPGDYIHADYLSGTIDGSRVKVVSITLQSHSS